MIDIESEAWLEQLQSKIIRQTEKLQHGIKYALPKSQKDLQTEYLREKTNGKKIENKMKALKLKKESYDLIDFALAEYLFLGFLGRMTRERLNLSKKIQHKIELEIQGAQRAKRTAKNVAKDIIKLIMGEEERIIREAKKAQIEDIKNWKEEEGIA